MASDFINVVNQIIGDIAGPFPTILTSSRQIGGIVSDVTIEEVHNDRLEISQHPIASGATVTDHCFLLPATLSVRCGSSDSSGNGFTGYSIQQYEAFLALQANRQLFSVDTGKRHYDNMLIREVQVTTDAQSENIVMLVVQLQQITLVQVGSAGGGGSTPASSTPSPSTVDQGQVTPYPVTTPLPTLGGGVGGIPVPNPSATGGIGSA